MALDLHQNFFSTQCLENKWTEFYQIYVGIVTHRFSHIITRVMALDLRQNFVSAHHLENKLIEFHQILYMHSYLI